MRKNYEEFSEWCEDRSKDLGFEIADIATDEVDLKTATEIRDKEAADFAVEEKELTTVIDVLHRAVAVLEEELGGASLMQVT